MLLRMPQTDQAMVDGLTILSRDRQPLLLNASLRVTSQETVGLTGPSGAGKTTLLRSLLGWLPPGCTCVSGTVEVCGKDVLSLHGSDLQRFRNRHLAFVAQDPGACLNPTMKVRSLLREAAKHNKAADFDHALEQVQLSKKFLRRRPGELSGGEQRRVALARALVRGVQILLIDEPLAGLHGPLRRQIITVLKSLAEDSSIAIVVTGHQVDLVNKLADRIVPVGVPATSGEPGKSSSTGVAPVRANVNRPTPAPRPRVKAKSDSGEMSASVLSGAGVVAWSGRNQILHGIDFVVPQGGITAMMGASGAGKTTLVRVLVGLHNEASGSLEFSGKPMHIAASRRDGRVRARIQYIPQNPLSTLNPVKTVRATIERPLKRGGRVPKDHIDHRFRELLATMGLDEDFGSRYPRELSGGQRQRVAIARALAADPDVLVCDEITSALDAKTAESIMRLLDKMVTERGLSLILISHELEEIRKFSDFVHVMANGRIVESGPTSEVFGTPGSLETRELLG